MKHFAELHDTAISDVKTSAGAVDLQVAHMSVFCQPEAGPCDVFSAHGVLHMLGSPAGDLGPGGGEILEVEGIPNLIELSTAGSLLRREFPIALVRFHLADGSSWAVQGTGATLELHLKGAALEEWDGPFEAEGVEGVLRLP